MEKVLFLNRKTASDAEIRRLSEHTMLILTEAAVNISGFRLVTKTGETYGKYEDYNTLYREVEGGFILSNDGSVYVEPEPQPESGPYVPTEEELKQIFEQNKTAKIAESKRMLAEYLEENPLQSDCHGGKVGTYSVTEEKQTLMANQYSSYMLEKQVTGSAELTWNETGKSCEKWTEEEFVALILAVKAYVYPHVSRQQAYEEQIHACTTQEALDAIEIVYGGAE